eukprot:CAMPEP_0168615510 /NCGR_PEP_ID=MMETSP0449_2-20121227/4540_1 /TAXON_ID=1082188 /ORGANISM="Strombidium rassoulzadegani, Strain ras09" /LENGTH=190 /DNA_ID=CAMNT_0008656249 /DNA_START=215 /DNA_END=786 /DNA_ORIENTATION=-
MVGTKYLPPMFPRLLTEKEAALEVGPGQLVVLGLVNQGPQVSVEIQDALLTHLLDVGSHEPIVRVDGHREVVIALDHVLLDHALSIQSLRVDHGVNHRELVHCQGNGLDEEGQQGQIVDVLLELLPDGEQPGHVDVVGEGEERNLERLRHGLGHRLLNTHDLLDLVLPRHARCGLLLHDTAALLGLLRLL